MSEELAGMDSMENPEVSTDMPTGDTTIANEPTDTVNVNEMSDEEFAAHMDGGSDMPTDKPEVEQTEEVSLDDLYTTQMEDPDAKLDKPVLVKFNGSVHKVDSIKELKNLAERGISMTQKSQKLSEQTQLIERLNANGYDTDSLMRLAEEHKGEPLQEMDTSSSRVNEIANTILQSDYVETFQEVTNQFPDEVKDELQRNPEMLEAIAYDIQSGLTGSIMPTINRLMAIQGMSFEDAYVKAGSEYNAANDKQAQQRETKVNRLNSQPKSNTHQATSQNKDVWSMTDSEFDKYFGT